MKKLVSIILLLALVCSLCATGVSAAALSPEELYEKYAALLDALEAEDYKTAAEEFSALLPAPEYTPVELTADNFFDYFEIVNGEPYMEKDSSGIIKTIYPGGIVLTLKEELRERLDWENSSLSVGITAKKDLYRAKINFETGEITLGDSKDSDVKKALKKLDWFEPEVDTKVDGVYSFYTLSNDPFWYKHPKYKAWSSGYAEPGLDTKYYQVVYRDIELVNVEGTLFLAADS